MTPYWFTLFSRAKRSFPSIDEFHTSGYRGFERVSEACEFLNNNPDKSHLHPWEPLDGSFYMELSGGRRWPDCMGTTSNDEYPIVVSEKVAEWILSRCSDTVSSVPVTVVYSKAKSVPKESAPSYFALKIEDYVDVFFACYERVGGTLVQISKNPNLSQRDGEWRFELRETAREKPSWPFQDGFKTSWIPLKSSWSGNPVFKQRNHKNMSYINCTIETVLAAREQSWTNFYFDLAEKMIDGKPTLPFEPDQKDWPPEAWSRYEPVPEPLD